MSVWTEGQPAPPGAVLVADGTLWVPDDGGRAEAGFKGRTGDCGTRALAIATGTPYREVYDEAHAAIKEHRARARNKRVKTRSTSPRDGMPTKVMDRLAAAHGGIWVPTMTIGSGCQTHVLASELPPGRLILRLSKHYAAFVDGVLHDTFDCSRAGTRCVYGYYTFEEDLTP